MATFALSDYTGDQQFAALRQDSRRITFRYEILDKDYTSKGDFVDVLQSGKVSYASLNDIKRVAQFTILENVNDDITRINFLSDMIRVWCDFSTDTIDIEGRRAPTLSFPLGTFILSSTSRDLVDGIVQRSVDGYDLGKLLAEDLLEFRYTIAVGADPVVAVEALLDDVGCKHEIQDTDVAMIAARSWDIGTSRLVIINELLSQLGYRSLCFDANGVAFSSEYLPPADRDITISYVTDDDSVLAEQVSTEFDIYSVPNRWVLVVSQPDRPVITATVSNDSTSSPTSIINRGRVITDFRSDNEEAVTEAQLLAKARRIANEASQVYEQISFQTLCMPIHGDSEILYVEHTDFISGNKFCETEWDITLDAQSMMNHKARRVVSIIDSAGGV